MSRVTTEWCPNCDGEQELRYDFVPQICSCGVVIYPCSICEQLHTEKGCTDCPLDVNAIYLTKEAREKLYKHDNSAVYALDFSKYISETSEPDELRFNIVERTDSNDSIIVILNNGKRRLKLNIDEFISCMKDV